MAEHRLNQDGVAEAFTELERSGKDADPRELAEVDRRLEELLSNVAEGPAIVEEQRPSSQAARGAFALPPVAMRTAKPLELSGKRVTLSFRGLAESVDGMLGPGVAPELLALAIENGDAVLVETMPDEQPMVVGVLQTRIPEKLVLKASQVHIEGERELLLRSGRGAMRIRQDGDVEIVGSRIAALSRGLFRLVGRVLRLN